MKELSDILQACSVTVDAALATVVRVDGSAYRRPGARMLITNDGRIVGGVSGGCLERDVIQRAGAVINSGFPVLVRYDTSSDPDNGAGYSLGCGGVIDILIEPLNTPDGEELLHWLKKSRLRPVTIATVISRNHTALGRHLYSDAAIAQMKKAELFIETINPPLNLVIFGSGSDALPLVGFARSLGWNITVVDLGSSSSHPDRTWNVPIVRCHVDEVGVRVSIDESCAVVVMTHNFNHDSKLIHWLSNQPLRYLGLLGPRHRTDQILGDIQKADLHSPVGLDLGAENPEEVALAIVAEITAVIRGRSGGLLSQSQLPIHTDSAQQSRGVSPGSGPTRPGSAAEIKEIACPVAAS